MRGLQIPFTRMGRVTSCDLFEPREQALFDFYEKHKSRYRRAIDIGANIGIHSILMAKCGWLVTAYEPDPKHFRQLEQNLYANDCFPDGEMSVVPINMAVSTKDGYAPFIRVLDNETANHLAGARESYGPREQIMVPTIDCRSLFAWADFAKIDCEGSEPELLLTVTAGTRCEFMVEVGTALAAAKIFNHFHGWREMWSQASGWGQVLTLNDMPKHYTQGAIFIGERP